MIRVQSVSLTRCLLALACAALLFAVGACGGGGDKDAARRVADDEARALLLDRNWMDAWPTSKDERIHVLRFTPGMGGGVYQERTMFVGHFELFLYELPGGDDADVIRFSFPETEERADVHFRIDEVDGPAPFDLRLTLVSSPRGPSEYFGRRAETGATDADLDATLRR
jgi:hypothetical protein